MRAELWCEAVTYLREAGERAVARSANREAVAFHEQALGALRHLPESRETFALAVDVRLDLRPPLLQLGRLDEIHRLSKEAESMAEQIGDEERQARAYSYLINYHYLRGEPARAIEYGARCLGIAERLRRSRAGHARAALHRPRHHAQGQAPDRRPDPARTTPTALGPEIVGAPSVATTTAFVASARGWPSRWPTSASSSAPRPGPIAPGREAEARRHPYSEAIAWTLTGAVGSRAASSTARWRRWPAALDDLPRGQPHRLAADPGHAARPLSHRARPQGRRPRAAARRACAAPSRSA